jgi:hypothetical protein
MAGGYCRKMILAMALYTHNIVTPAKAGAHHLSLRIFDTARGWIPAFAGMTKIGVNG